MALDQALCIPVRARDIAAVAPESESPHSEDRDCPARARARGRPRRLLPCLAGAIQGDRIHIGEAGIIGRQFRRALQFGQRIGMASQPHQRQSEGVMQRGGSGACRNPSRRTCSACASCAGRVIRSARFTYAGANSGSSANAALALGLGFFGATLSCIETCRVQRGIRADRHCNRSVDHVLRRPLDRMRSAARARRRPSHRPASMRPPSARRE